MSALLKPIRESRPAYKRWIKAHVCLLTTGGNPHGCLGPIDPHHVIPRSLGGSDYTCVPLCRKHHEEANRREVFEAKYAILFDYEIEQLQKEYRKVEFTTRAKPKREQNKKPYVKRYILRAFAVLLPNEGLDFPVFRTSQQAQDWRKLYGGKVVRVQIREEGRK